MFWVAFCTFYSFLKNKFFFMWVYNDFSYEWIKFVYMSISFSLCSVFSYPLYFIREMVDIWPKERGGHCTWNNSYREAIKWQLQNWELMYTNFFSGYWRWFSRYGAAYFIGIWVADNLGMFSNCNEGYGSLETQFPISSESVWAVSSSIRAKSSLHVYLILIHLILNY